MLEFRILGPLEVVGDEGPIHLGGPKQRATLAILLLSANRVVSVERLADDLYSGAAPVTAVTQVQRQISELRKTLGGPTIETRAPGYVIRLAPDQLDLRRFERRAEEATQALAQGKACAAADLFADALELWRGPPLADLAYEPFAQISIERLEEIRLAAVEQRIDADLALGGHAQLIVELEELVAEHPLHEGLRGKLMLSLYRSGRQAEALDVYRRTRAALVEEFGIEPSPALHVLERAILTQDPALDLEPVGGGRRAVADAQPDRTVLVLPSEEYRLDELLAVAEPLAMLPGRELLIARLLPDEVALAGAASAMNARRAALQAPTRVATFTTHEPADDVVRLAATYGVELVLLDAPAGLDADQVPDLLAAILERSPADVAVLSGAMTTQADAGVFVPFGGGENDWAALELGAWLASATGAPLRLIGSKADPRRARRDASRMLADASLAVQRLVRVESEPLLVEPTEEALAVAVEPAGLVVFGISPRWQVDGLGASRRALIRRAWPPVLLVHRGPRPSGLSPRGSRTRFSWTVEDQAAVSQ